MSNNQRHVDIIFCNCGHISHNNLKIERWMPNIVFYTWQWQPTIVIRQSKHSKS